ncbi:MULTISPECIES: hypothetical protein [unclassified Acinetobacter]|uniref:hypothetical protein n=1 Tax=unclassified Acinetobacter TaxID=196816 RepID=UPI00288248A9|nr:MULTISPECIES: hypothetical protein [unclassified Acinetobacter]MDT0198792.1 hypothetical protein [Acinetobacter sp. RG5]MDT0230434.1 hypothetical protein [Acinetobacter sp. RRD8]
MKIIYVGLILIMLISCKPAPNDIDIVLENQSEQHLAVVIIQYKGGEKKLKNIAVGDSIAFKIHPSGDTGLTIFGLPLPNHPQGGGRSEAIPNKLPLTKFAAVNNYIEAGSSGDIRIKINSNMEADTTLNLKSKY